MSQTDRRTDRQTDGRTLAFLELLSQLKTEGILTGQVLTVTALPADDQTYESVKYLLAPKYNYLAPNGRGLVYTRDK